jgi:myo-inositol-1(or 4)-monophosphatase
MYYKISFCLQEKTWSKLQTIKTMGEFIKKITKKAGAAALKKFGKIGVKYTKENPGDVVTEGDLIANKIIVDAIKKEYPDHGIISEEMPAYQKDAEYIWMIDPIDGTRNFATGTPTFAVMIAVAKKGKLQYSTVFNPATNDFFFAKNGGGAYHNGVRIHCGRASKLAYSFGCFAAGWTGDKLPTLKGIIKATKRHPIWMSTFGCTGISGCYVADGRRDWYVGTGNTIWDFAPPALILTEAGAKITNLKGEPWQFHHTEFITANPKLHPQILAMAQGKL